MKTELKNIRDALNEANKQSTIIDTLWCVHTPAETLFDYIDRLLAEPPAKYDDTLLPFLALMRKELHANAHKGDREGWVAMNPGECLLEIYYHMGKLQKAVKGYDRFGIREFAADVANMAMMLVDICALLTCSEKGCGNLQHEDVRAAGMCASCYQKDCEEGMAQAAQMAENMAKPTAHVDFDPGRNLVVDGAMRPDDPDGPEFQGDGQYPPFVVFDVDNQQNLPGHYPTREAAEAARLDMLAAAQPAKCQQCGATTVEACNAASCNCLEAGNGAPTLKTFTVFCRDASNTGTTWIGSVEAEDQEEAAMLGRKQCLEDWTNNNSLVDLEDIVALGVAEGDVKILAWDDPE